MLTVIGLLTFLVGLAGAVMVSAGAWLITPAAGLITGGVLCICCSCIWARALGKPTNEGGS